MFRLRIEGKQGGRCALELAYVNICSGWVVLGRIWSARAERGGMSMLRCLGIYWGRGSRSTEKFVRVLLIGRVVRGVQVRAGESQPVQVRDSWESQKPPIIPAIPSPLVVKPLPTLSSSSSPMRVPPGTLGR